MSWNYRVVKDNDLFYITEVHYGEDGKPCASAAVGGLYGINILGGHEDLWELAWTATEALTALKKPVLTYVDGKLVEQ